MLSVAHRVCPVIVELQMSFFLIPGSLQSRLVREMAVVCFLSGLGDVTPFSPAKLQLDTGWTPHMSGKGGVVL